MDGLSNEDLRSFELLGVDDLAKQLVSLQETGAQLWEELAFKNGYDLERGDQIILPYSCEFIIPLKWKQQIYRSPYVTAVTFKRAIGHV